MALSPDPVLILDQLALARGDRQLFDGLSLALQAGEKLGLIGDNGAGKSTLVSVIIGREKPDRGSVALRGGVKVAHLEQVIEGGVGLRVGDALAAPFAAQRGRIVAWEAAVATLDPRADRLQNEIEAHGGFDWEYRVKDVAIVLGVAGLEDREVHSLSGGQRKRVALAQVVLAEADLVILDEPTNHLDTDTIEWLEGWLARAPCAALIVTHDRAFLDAATDGIAELREGQIRKYPSPYEAYLEARAEEERLRETLGHRKAQLLKGELEWARRQPAARTVKSAARLDRVTALGSEVRQLQAERAKAEFDFGSGAPRLARTVVALEGATIAYDGAPPLTVGLDLILGRGERLGVVGPNGVGKTSLLRVIDGTLALRAGVREVGVETRVAVFDQHRELLDAETTVAGAVAPEGNDTVFPGGKPVHIAAYLSKFNFPAAHHRRPVRTLSGGERNRLALARFLLTPANLLLLDEPTNDLDLDTVRTLEEALVSFDGTVVVVSHDRMFLDRVATRLLVFEALPDGGRGTWLQPGGWATYRRLRGEALAAEREAARRAAIVRAREPAKAAKAAAAAVPTPKGLSGTEKRELAKLEARIAAIEEELAGVQAGLADGSAWAGDGSRGRELDLRRQALETELGPAMGRWEALAERA